MTPAEFQAWLEGFSEAIQGAPTADQWQKVLEKVATIEAFKNDPLPVTVPWSGPVSPRYPRWPKRYAITCDNTGGVLSGTSAYLS